MAPMSTHTDEEGNVIAVYDDGNLGVYKHSTMEIRTLAKTKQRFENDIDKQVGYAMDISATEISQPTSRQASSAAEEQVL